MIKAIVSAVGLVFLFVLFNFLFLHSQDAYDSEVSVPVTKYLNMVAHGRSDEVRRILPDLMVSYPDDPGVKLLTGSILQNAFKATEIYESIIAQYPESQWADDAMWRVIQFYAIMGDTAKAQSGLTEMREKYPLSDFLVPASDIVRSSVGLSRARLRDRNTKLAQIQNILEKANSNVGGEKIENKTDKLRIKMPINQAIKIEAQPTEVLPASQMINHDEIGEPVNAAEQILKNQIKMQKNASDQDKEKMINNDEERIDKVEDDGILPLGIGTGTYGLQVGIYANKLDAESEKDKYIAQRMTCEVRRMDNDKGSFYVVLIGNYSSLSSAQAAKMIVNEQCQCNPIVVEK